MKKILAGRLPRELIQTIAVELLGCFIAAVGINNFAVAAQIPMTGFSGIAYIINYLAGLPIGWTLVLLNIPLAAICYRRLGGRFFWSSLWCMLLTSLMIDYAAPLLPAYGGERMLASIATGVLCGIGYTLIYIRSSSTGGSDFIIMSVKSMWPHLQIGYINFAFDMVIILISGFIFADADGIIYGLITSFLTSVVMDKIIMGVNIGKLALIVTDDGKKICAVIDSVCQRGSTILPALGGYMHTDKELVICACSTKQLSQLRQAVKAADAGSFVVVVNSSEVYGDGFKMLQLGEKAERTDKK